MEIPTKVLKKSATHLAFPLTDIFNLALATHTFPNDLKIALVTPLYKGKGEKCSIDNYRPISTISPIAKVFETILADKI